MKTQIKFLHDCLLIKNILIIGDLHIGYDEQSDGKPLFPGLQLEEIIGKLREVFRYLKKEDIEIKKVILLGDVKHDFRTITDIEWRETLKFFDFLKENIDIKNKNRIIVIKGNHDNILEPITRKSNILLKNYYKIIINEKKYYFLHGDKILKECLDADFLILGHLHPAIILNDKYKYEKYKCFLKGKLNKKNIIILPSFNDVKYGYNLNITDKDNNSFISNKQLKEFEVIIYNNLEKKDYNFGKLKNLI